MAFSMAFQPIVDISSGRAFAYEALVRGPAGEGAHTVLSQLTEDNRYAFDQSCRVQAIMLASKLGMANTGASLSINFLPGAVYSPAACIRATLNAARDYAFPLDRLIFEVTEGEKMVDTNHVEAIAREYKRHGFRIAMDDFGAAFANLDLLAELSADIVKLDMALVRNLHQRPKAEVIVRAALALCESLNITFIAEGVETAEEFAALRRCGIHLMQGYFFAKPAFEALPDFTIPEAATT